MQLYLCRPGDQPIGDHRRQTAAQKRVLAIKAPARHQVVALVQFRQQGGNVPRIVLRISVHHGNDAVVNRFTPKSSTVNDATTEPYTMARRIPRWLWSPERASWPKNPPAKESPAPVGSKTSSNG